METSVSVSGRLHRCKGELIGWFIICFLISS